MAKTDYLCLTNKALAWGAVNLKSYGSATSLWTGSYSTDGTTWKTYTPGAAISVFYNQSVYFKGTLTGDFSSSNYLQFRFSSFGEGSWAASGNVMSLTHESDFTTRTELSYAYEFYKLFQGCTGLTKAPELPATTLTDHCYCDMFYGCTSLTQVPELPATTLATYCYYYMFYGCTGLTQVPELPATTLTDHCYGGMFYGCTSLQYPPELPATTLATYCYYYMFYGCTGLTQVPELPATTLANYCYGGMFYGCTGLTKTPELPATTLTDYCYYSMFYGCTGLLYPPELPATTLTDYCYYSMFYGCTNICLSTTEDDTYTQEYRIPSTGTGIVGTNSLTGMFSTTGGTFTGTPTINTTYYTIPLQITKVVAKGETIISLDKVTAVPSKVINNSDNIVHTYGGRTTQGNYILIDKYSATKSYYNPAPNAETSVQCRASYCTNDDGRTANAFKTITIEGVYYNEETAPDGGTKITIGKD